MPNAAPGNFDLPSSWLSPGVYTSLDTTGAGAGINSVTKRLLLVGQKLSTGSQATDSPVQITTSQDAFNFFGRGSDLVRMFQAAESQVGAGIIDVYGCAV